MWATADTLTVNAAVSLASVAAGRVLPLVIKNYSQNIAESQKIVHAIIGRFGSPRSSPNEAFFLVGGLTHIVRSDPDTAVEVCTQIFTIYQSFQGKNQICSPVFLSFSIHPD